MIKKASYNFHPKTKNKYKALALVLLVCITGSVRGQNNLTALFYGTPSGSWGAGTSLDVTVLDGVFGTVNVNGANRTADFVSGMTVATLPTTLATFSGIQLVVVRANGAAVQANTSITKAQADNLIAYVKQGGVLVGNMEGVMVSTVNKDFNVYMGEHLLTQPSLSISATAYNTAIGNPFNTYHNLNGTLNLNNGATTVPTTSSASTFTGIPSESIVYASVKPTNASQCNSGVLDFVAPSYPGDYQALTSGILGFAYLSGEAAGPLNASGGARDNLQANINLAQMIYDFLYTPTTMATRRAWSKTPANVNSFCPVATLAVECHAGITPPPIN